MKKIIAGMNAQGRSYVAERAELELGPGAGRVWATDAIADPTTALAEHGVPICPTLEPPPGGSRMSVLVLGPGRDGPNKPGRAPIPGMDDDGFHTTRTIDFDYVIEGDMVLELDEESVELEPGDFVILPAVRHAWRNAGDGPAKMLCTLVSLVRAE